MFVPVSVNLPAADLGQTANAGIEPEIDRAGVVVTRHEDGRPERALPAPASEPIFWLKLLRSSVAPPATVNALNGEKAFAAPACSVPRLIVVCPV